MDKIIEINDSLALKIIDGDAEYDKKQAELKEKLLSSPIAQLGAVAFVNDVKKLKLLYQELGISNNKRKIKRINNKIQHLETKLKAIF